MYVIVYHNERRFLNGLSQVVIGPFETRALAQAELVKLRDKVNEKLNKPYWQIDANDYLGADADELVDSEDLDEDAADEIWASIEQVYQQVEDIVHNFTDIPLKAVIIDEDDEEEEDD